MYFETLQEVLSMEGHGSYVWSAFFFSATVIVGMLGWPQVKLKRVIERLKLRYEEA